VAGTAWTFADDGAGLLASRYVYARPQRDTALTSFTVTFSSASVATPHQLVTLSTPVTPSTSSTNPAPAPATSAEDGVWAGFLTLTNGGATPPGIAPFAIPVMVWKKGTTYLFFDRTRALSPTGKIRVAGKVGGTAVDYPAVSFHWLGEPVSGAQVSGGIVATAALSELAFDVAEQALKGKLSVSLPTATSSLIYSFAFGRQDALSSKACATSADCPRDEACDSVLLVCAPGPQWQAATPGSTANTLIHEQKGRWVSAVSGGASAPKFAANGLFSTPRGWRKLLRLGQLTFGEQPSPTGMAESALCYDSLDSQGLGPTDEQCIYAEQEPRLNTKGFGRSLQEVSGDLLCTDGRPPLGFGIFSSRDQAGMAGPGAMARTCLDELALEPPSVDSSLPVLDQGRKLMAASGGGCVSLPRLLTALVNLPATRDYYQGVRPGGAGDYWGAQDQRLYSRLLQQWLELHSFLATAGPEEDEITKVLSSSASSSTSSSALPSPSDTFRESLLGQLESGWALLLEPATLARLLALPPSVLRRPDYRQRGPVAYWTFDKEDLIDSPRAVRDVAGDNHVLLADGWISPEETAGRGGILLGQTYLGSPITPRFKQSAPQVPPLNGELSISFWLRVDDIVPAQSGAYLFTNTDGATSAIEVSAYVDAAGQVAFYVKDKRVSDASPTRVDWPYRASKGQLLHVTITRVIKGLTACDPGTEYVLYVNGAAQKPGTVGGAQQPNSIGQLGPWFINTRDDATTGATISGLLDDLAIWDRTLEAAEIATLYKLGRNGEDNPALQVPIRVPTSANHEQPVGLPVKLLETMSAHLRYVQSYVKDSSLKSYAETLEGGEPLERSRALDALGRAMRFSYLIETLATQMHDRAPSVACSDNSHCAAYAATCHATTSLCVLANGQNVQISIPWEDRYAGAKAELASVRSQLLAEGLALRTGENPLGIDEDDLPLFFGDPQGTNSRFFASSDYLLSTWAAPAVAGAQAALDAARSAWLEQRNGRIQDQMSRDEADRRVEQLQAQYGNTIVQYCGLQDLDSRDALEAFDPETGYLTPDGCYIDEQRPECTLSASLPADGLEEAEVQFGLCTIDAMHRVALERTKCGLWKYTGKGRGRRRVKETALVECSDPAANPWHSVAQEPLGLVANYRQAYPDGEFIYFRDTGKGMLVAELYRLKNIADLETILQGKAGTRSPSYAVETCMTNLGIKDTPLPNISKARPKRLEINACLRGELGKAALVVTGAQQDVQIAIDRWEQVQHTYGNALKHCRQKGAGLKGIEDLDKAFNDHMTSLIEAKREAETVLGMLATASELVSTASRAIATGGVSLGTDAMSGSSPAGTLLQHHFKQELINISADMELAKLNYQSQLLVQQNWLTLQDCFYEADRLRLEIDPAASQITRSLTDAAIAMVNIRNLKREISQKVIEGQAAVEREKGRTVPSLAHHHWLSEKVDRYRREFDWSQRLTFLAMRAVEFEFQQSLPLRGKILAAVNAADLSSVILQLQQEQAGRSINRRRPEETSLVLSVRDDILRLEDRSTAQFGERKWSPSRRFRERLMSQLNAVYDDKGRYLGQGLSVTLSEMGELRLRCAERLWRATATIQGDFLDVNQPHAPLVLMKQNTFESQWCAGHGEKGTHQVASIRPSAQLFRGEEHAGNQEDTKGHTSALLYPYFNVRRSDFYREEYRQGGSEELAGRGLYGNYVLLFPYDGLLEPDVDFPIDSVEDILVRFDILSIDNVPSL
jgi:hypothetical protein